MKKAKIGISVIIGIVLTSLVVYDLLPYHGLNHVTHEGSTSRTFDLSFNSTTYYWGFEIKPFIDIQDTLTNTISADHISDNINVSFLIESNQEYIYVLSTFIFFSAIETNATHTCHGVPLSENSHWCRVFMPRNTTSLSFVFSYTANYSVEMIYHQSPKTFVWGAALSFLTTKDVILVGVVLFATILIYASYKMARD